MHWFTFKCTQTTILSNILIHPTTLISRAVIKASVIGHCNAICTMKQNETIYFEDSFWAKKIQWSQQGGTAVSHTEGLFWSCLSWDLKQETTAVEEMLICKLIAWAQLLQSSFATIALFYVCMWHWWINSILWEA